MHKRDIHFNSIYDLYIKYVYNVALYYSNSTCDAEEITQDVFLKVYELLSADFETTRITKSWILRVTINQCLDNIKHKKRKKRFGFLFEIGDSLGLSYSAKTPETILDEKILQNEIEQAINSLPEKQKQAFILSKLEGISNIEIAEILNTSIGGVESLLTRAKNNLKKMLHQE